MLIRMPRHMPCQPGRNIQPASEPHQEGPAEDEDLRRDAVFRDASSLASPGACVRGQTIPAHHVLVCDGSAPAQIDAFAGTHIVLRRNYRDYGNIPRLIGCYSAVAGGADAMAFLDGDNWYQPDHLESLLRFARDNRLDACSSARMLYRPDGSLMTKCTTVNGRPYVDQGNRVNQ